MRVELAETDEQIAACYEVMAELRPDLVRAEFTSRIRRLERDGFRLAFASDGAGPVAVAGFRVFEKLVTGLSLYVDDLVTTDRARSQGYGRALLQWLVGFARERGCRCLELDSGVQRFAAHRFYLRERMIIRSHHFVLEL